MKKILLTGGTGFVGGRILKELEKNFKITILIRNKKLKKINKKIKYLYFDNIKNLSAILKKKNFDTVIHCATYYKKKHSEEDIKKMIDANIHLGIILLENCKKIKFTKFINFTSVWENYNNIKNNPINLYSALKLSFSKIIEFYKKEYKNVKFFNLYLSETFGPQDKRRKLLSVLKDNYNKNLTTTITSRNLNINIININDIVSALKLILKKDIKQGNYNIINYRYINIGNLIYKFNRIKSKKIKVKWKSAKILKEKIIRYSKLPGWKPIASTEYDLINYIENK